MFGLWLKRLPMRGAETDPERVAKLVLQQSMATREPNLEPRRETMCFLECD